MTSRVITDYLIQRYTLKKLKSILFLPGQAFDTLTGMNKKICIFKQKIPDEKCNYTIDASTACM